MIYGVKFKKVSDQQEHDYWFDDYEDRQEFMKRLNNSNFLIIDLMELKQDYLKFG